VISRFLSLRFLQKRKALPVPKGWKEVASPAFLDLDDLLCEKGGVWARLDAVIPKGRIIWRLPKPHLVAAEFYRLPHGIFKAVSIPGGFSIDGHKYNLYGGKYHPDISGPMILGCVKMDPV
jgi:hypothetical protein